MPVLTLTSDIGLRDFLVGAVKGQILQTNDAFHLVDISHEIVPFNYAQTAYVVKNVIKHFPPETFHLVLTNLFHQKPEHLLIARIGDQYLGLADNGLITMIADGMPDEVVAIPLDKQQIRNTIYCTKVLTQAFTDMLSGKALSKLGDPNFPIQAKNPLRALHSSNYIEGQIIYIDRFENVIVNITKEEFETQRKGRRFKIIFKRDQEIDRISESYADAQEGTELALFNSAGYLEIAINKGNAAGLFGLQGYTEKSANQSQFMQSRLYYQTIRVIFE